MPASIIAEPAQPKTPEAVNLKRLLVATDFSDASQRSLMHALTFARHYDSELVIVHAVEPEPREPIPLDPLPRELDTLWDKAQYEMEKLTARAEFKGIPHHSVIRRGEIVDVVSHTIANEHIDLLITGTHGRRGLAKLALGSIAEQILHIQGCPILTVGPSVRPVAKGGIALRNILFATDFGHASLKALPYAIALAASFGAKLVLLHLVEPMPVADITPAAYGPPSYVSRELSKWQSERKRESEERLLDLVASAKGLRYTPKCEVGMDLAPEGILQTARDWDSDLIVLGVNHADSPRLASHFPWLLTSEVIRKARCPVLTLCA